MAGRRENRRRRFPVNPGGQACPKGETIGDLEGGGHVLGLLVHGDAGLSARAADPDEEVRPDLGEIPGQARKDGGRGARRGGCGGGLFVIAGADRPSRGRAG